MLLLWSLKYKYFLTEAHPFSPCNHYTVYLFSPPNGIFLRKADLSRVHGRSIFSEKKWRQMLLFILFSVKKTKSIESPWWKGGVPPSRTPPAGKRGPHQRLHACAAVALHFFCVVKTKKMSLLSKWGSLFPTFPSFVWSRSTFLTHPASLPSTQMNSRHEQKVRSADCAKMKKLHRHIPALTVKGQYTYFKDKAVEVGWIIRVVLTRLMLIRLMLIRCQCFRLFVHSASTNASC